MNASSQLSSPDALLPIEMARKSELLGEKKASLDLVSTLVLAVLAGAFIGLGGLLYTVVTTTGDVEIAFGFKKLVGGIAFSLGLILVVIGGAELFTGNNLIVMAWASRRISTAKLIRNWLIVYVGNFIGAIGIAILTCLAGVHTQSESAVGETIHSIASHKCQLPWMQAFFSGVGCNLMVCLAVWLCFSARSVTDKVLAIVFPISAFVATGMEHCVANMYFVPASMLLPDTPDKPEAVNLINFVTNNLIPVSLGNVFGGAVLVGLVYWFVYLRNACQTN